MRARFEALEPESPLAAPDTQEGQVALRETARHMVRLPPAQSETAFQFLDLDGYQAFYWVDTEISYALAGQVGKDRLRSLALNVYEQLI